MRGAAQPAGQGPWYVGLAIAARASAAALLKIPSYFCQALVSKHRVTIIILGFHAHVQRARFLRTGGEADTAHATWPPNPRSAKAHERKPTKNISAPREARTPDLEVNSLTL